MFERFVRDARAIVVEAQREARAADAPAIGVEHLLVATAARCPMSFCEPPSSWVRATAWQPPDAAARLRDALRRQTRDALGSLGISLDEIETRARESFGDDEWEAVARAPRLPFTAEAKRVLEESLRVALEFRTRRIASPHVLVALLRHERARELLRAAGLDPDALHARGVSELTRLADLVAR